MSAHRTLEVMWIAFIAYWVLRARAAKPVERAERSLEAALGTAVLVIAAVLLAVPELHLGPLDARPLGDPPGRHMAGLVLAAAGLALAVWARELLGGNWSGRVVVKEGHTLVRSGPYRCIRHPIYTGVLAALAGTAVFSGEWRGVAGLGLFVAGLWWKARREERLMAAEFGARYTAYRRQAGMFLPRARAVGGRGI